MADNHEIIDLTDSPPSSPPRPSPSPSRSRSRRILRFKASTSSRKVRFKIKRSSQSTQNPNSGHITHQVSPWLPPSPSSQIYDFSQIINDFHSNMHGDQAQDQLQIVVVDESNMDTPITTFLVTKHSEPWTPQEHEQFLKGLAEFGCDWTRIASELVVSKTEEQVESYAISFFKHLTYICLYCLKRNNQTPFTSFITFPSATMEEHVNPTTKEEDVQPTVPPTLTLFPLTNGAHLNASTSTSTTTRVNNVIAPNPSMPAATAQAGPDLELRLGMNHGTGRA